ncbi:hypothetical protein MZM54_04155 [[Brevibacterium] frigoritolerans]|nr:hypothetical protein [Peribacillus frigoritolerans]
MKNIFLKLAPRVVTICSLCSLVLIEPVITQVAPLLLMATQEQETIYAHRTSNIEEAGYVTKGNDNREIRKFDPKWMKREGCVSSFKALPALSKSYSIAATLCAFATPNFLAIKNIPVYDNTSGASVEIGIIKKGQSYPILLETGKGRFIDVEGRVGYVHSTLANVKGKQSANMRPTTRPTKKVYIKAIIDAPLYDTRRGSLDEVGKLIKGQELEVVSDFGTSWWKVKWANTFVYVAKSSVEKNHTKDFENNNISFASKNKHIIPLQNDTPIYDISSGVFVPFATLKDNHRYPYIQKFG